MVLASVCSALSNDKKPFIPREHLFIGDLMEKDLVMLETSDGSLGNYSNYIKLIDGPKPYFCIALEDDYPPSQVFLSDIRRVRKLKKLCEDFLDIRKK